MYNKDTIIIIMLALFLIAIVALMIITIVTNTKYKSKIEQMELYKFNASATIDDTIPKILDLIILHQQ